MKVEGTCLPLVGRVVVGSPTFLRSAEISQIFYFDSVVLLRKICQKTFEWFDPKIFYLVHKPWEKLSNINKTLQEKWAISTKRWNDGAK